MFTRTIAIAAAAILLSAGAAGAQKLDANGRCHDASGKFAKQEVCGGMSKSSKSAKSAGTAAAPAAATAGSAAKSSAKASNKCRNDKGKYVKCGSPGAHPA
jgi:hypothetical protein